MELSFPLQLKDEESELVSNRGLVLQHRTILPPAEAHVKMFCFGSCIMVLFDKKYRDMTGTSSYFMGKMI